MIFPRVGHREAVCRVFLVYAGGGHTRGVTYIYGLAKNGKPTVCGRHISGYELQTMNCGRRNTFNKYIISE